MSVKFDAFKICATCRHLKTLKTDREFQGIIDTEYTQFKCQIRGWETREFYLMAPVPTQLGGEGEENPFRCEFWEEWKITEAQDPSPPIDIPTGEMGGFS